MKLIKRIKKLFGINEHTPSFIISGLMGCAVSAVLIAIRLILFYWG